MISSVTRFYLLLGMLVGFAQKFCMFQKVTVNTEKNMTHTQHCNLLTL